MLNDEVAEDVKEDLLVQPNFPDLRLKPRLPTRTVGSSEVVSKDLVVCKDANHRGVMVALRIPHSAALRVALPGGEPPEDLHCTIAYLGDADELDPDRREDLVRRLKAVAATTPPLSGTLTGYGRFRDEERDQDVLWVGLDSPDLPALRHRVVQACEDAAVPLAGEHGFSPHVTLSYVDEGAGEDSMSAPTEVEFKWISLVVAGTELQMRLAGDAREHDKAPQEPYAYSWSMLMRPEERDLTSLPELERWAQGKGDLVVRAVPDAQACVVVKKGRDVHVAIQAWDAPAYLDDLVVALRRVPHDYVIEGWIAARDLGGAWVPRLEMDGVLCADVVANPVLMPRDLLALDGDLTGRTAADRLELLRGLVAPAGSHVIVPLQVACGADDELEAAVDACLAWRPSEGAGLAVTGAEAVQAGSEYTHGPSAAVARLCVRQEAAKGMADAMGAGPGPTDVPEGERLARLRQGEQAEPGFLEPEKSALSSCVGIIPHQGIDSKQDVETIKDAAPGVFGTPGVFGILSPEQGVFHRPRLPRNVDKEFGDNVSVGVPLTLVPTRPRGSRKPEDETSNPGGPLFPHFVGGPGTGVHKYSEDQPRDEQGQWTDAGGTTVRERGSEVATNAVAALRRAGHFYRGMTSAEYSATLGSGRGVASRQDWSVGGEGTSFSDAPEDAESYVNFGSTDPRATGEPTYLVEVRGQEGLARTPDGYLKAQAEIPRDRVTRVFRMDDKGGALVAHQISGEAPRRANAAHRTEGAPADPAYVYHATNEERADEIAESGHLRPHGPSYGTDQGAWPDGSREKRSYFSSDPKVTESFAPEEGKPVFLRVPRAAHEFRRESTGDHYATKPIPAHRIEYLASDGTWAPLRPGGVAKELWSGAGNYPSSGDSFSVGPGVVGGHRFVVGRLKDGVYVADPAHPRVNPYEAIFLRRGVSLRKYSEDQPRDAEGKWTEGGGGRAWWHGSPTGNLGPNVPHAIHVRTYEAATQALEARIGIPADGRGWDGTRAYGETKLAGTRSIASGKYGENKGSGHNAGPGEWNGTAVPGAPEEDYYPRERADRPTYANGQEVRDDDRPDVLPVRIKGEMTNAPESPHSDAKANGLMAASLKRGNAKRGFYYQNVGEDVGSISAIVPHPSHLERLPKTGVAKTSLYPDRAPEPPRPEGDDRFRAEEQTANPDSRKPRKWPDAPEEAGFNDSYLSKSDEPLYLTAADLDEDSAEFVAAFRAGCVEKYAEDQPRVPAGSPEGGQFAGGSARAPSMTQWSEWMATQLNDRRPPVAQEDWVASQVRAGGWTGSVEVFTGNGPKFDVGDAHFTEGGHYSPGQDHVVVYLDSETPEGVAGIAAHEGAHGLWHAAMPELDRQVEAVRNIANARDSGDMTPPEGLTEQEWKDFPFRSISSDRLHPMLAPKFPLAAAYRELTHAGMPEVAASGSNVSPYAAAWWAKWNTGGAHTDSAMNETVAEIEKLSRPRSPKADPAERAARMGRLGVSKAWLDFHDEVVKAGRRAEKRGDEQKAASAAATTTVIGPEGWGEQHEADGTIRMLRPLRVQKYSEDQARDEAGRWTDGGGMSGDAAGRGIMYQVEEPDRIEPTPDEARGVDGKVRLKDCYRQAGRYATDHGATLAHGTITPGHGVPLGHAWAEVKRPDGTELVYDGVQGKFYSRGSYYRSMRAVPEKTYTADEARIQMLRSKHWGPWHQGVGV